MIRPRKHLESIHRTTQDWLSRSEYLRLDFNELVPYLESNAFEEIKNSIQPWMFSAYPEINQVYAVLARYLKTTEKHVILTSGSDAGIRQVMEAFCDPGDEVLITYPTYGMYAVYSEIFACSCVKVSHKADFAIDTQEIIDHISGRCKIVAIANPNGAIGCVISASELESIIHAASERGAVVLLDEAYIHFYTDEWSSRVNDFDNVVLLRTFSKAGGLAGLRFGYILTNPYLASYLYRVKPVVEINSMAVLAGTYLLQHPEVIDRAVDETIKGRNFLSLELARLEYEVYEGPTNFLQVRFGDRRRCIYHALASDGIRVRDQSGSELLSDYIRITAGPLEYMKRVVKVISSAAKE